MVDILNLKKKKKSLCIENKKSWKREKLMWRYSYIFTVIIRECWPSRFSPSWWISMHFIEFVCEEFKILIDFSNKVFPLPSWLWLLRMNYFSLTFNESKSPKKRKAAFAIQNRLLFVFKGRASWNLWIFVQLSYRNGIFLNIRLKLND